jgi:Phage tail baseplate hub (GPD)
MAHESLRLEIGGSEIPELYASLLALEVELDEELAGMFRFSLALQLNPDGSWTFLDDPRLVPWQTVTVTAGPEEAAEQLISGYITHLRPDFADGLDQCRLEIWGMDASVLLDRDDVLKEWPNKKDSDIVRETFAKYGLSSVVTDTEIIHDEKVSTIIQRETDMQFLRRLALRNGYECFVDGEQGYFRPPPVEPASQPVLALHFGAQTNVTRLRLEVNALASTEVTMAQVDLTAKDVLEADAQPGVQRALGAKPMSGFLGPGMVPGTVVIANTVTTGGTEMAALCQGLYDRAAWCVTGDGEVDSSQYGSVLKPRATIVVKGLGRVHSGTYYVTRVTHEFTPDGYRQLFSIKRNAVEPTGTEQFADTGLLGVAL